MEAWQVDALRRLVSPDLNASAGARVLVQHVVMMGEGDHEVSYAVLMRLLRCGEDKVRSTIREASSLGLVVRTQTGRGHSPCFSYSLGDPPTLSDRVGVFHTLSADRVGDSPTLNTPPSSPSPSPPSSPRGSAMPGDITLAHLRKLVGDVADVFDCSAAHPPAWAASVWGWFRPPATMGDVDGGGTEWMTLAVLKTRDEQVLALTKAMGDYALTGKPFAAKLFRGFVRDAVREVQRCGAEALAPTGTDGRARASPRRPWEKKPMDAQDYNPTTEFTGFNG